jgi:hypothetical protein
MLHDAVTVVDALIVTLGLPVSELLAVMESEALALAVMDGVAVTEGVQLGSAPVATT